MTIKKMLLLASMALAAVAFAVPAAASAHAPEWYIHTEEGEEKLAGEEELYIVGELSSTVIGGGGLVIGPCEIELEGTAFNENGMAGGSITGGSIQTECPTNVGGCTFTPTMENFPWKVTGVTITNTTGVEINNITVTKHFMGQCPVPTMTISVQGTATSIVNSPSTITFEGHLDDLFLEPPLPALRVDIGGEVEIRTPLTLK